MASNGRLLVSAVLLGFLGSMSWALTPQSDPLESAKRAYLEGRFEDSVDEITPLLGTLKDTASLRDANFFLGLNNMALGHEADAGKYFRAAVRHDPAFLPSETLYAPDVVKVYFDEHRTLVGRLHVESEPPGALVTVAGRELGRAPLQNDVLMGEQLVRVELEGYIPEERVTSVQANDDTTLTISLRQIETPETAPVEEEIKGVPEEQVEPSAGGGGMSGKTIGIIAGAGGAAAVALIAAGGGGDDPDPNNDFNRTPEASRANVDVSIAPNPIMAQASGDRDFPWLINFEVNFRETAGLGGNIDFINTILINAATGTEVPALNFGANQVASSAGTNHLNARGSLQVPLGVVYRLSGGERRAALIAVIRFTDDRGNVQNLEATANVQ